MVRNVAIAGFTAAMLLGLGAQAQEVVPELAGGPGSHPAPPQQTLATRQAKAAADKLKADQAKLAKQAADLKAQQVKLDERAAELAAEEKRLVKLRADQEADQAAKLAEIARQKKAVEQQTAALHAEQKSKPLTPPQAPRSVALQTKPLTQTADASTSSHSPSRVESRSPDANAGAPIDITKPEPIKPPAEKAELTEKPVVAEKHAVPDKAFAPEQPSDKSPDKVPDRAPDRPAFADRGVRDTPPDAPPAPLRDATPDAPPHALTARLDLNAARQSCARAGENAALARRYYSARYDDAVRVYQDDGWKLRGRMRLEGRRGDLLIDTVCEVDASGEAQHFAFLRSSAERD